MFASIFRALIFANLFLAVAVHAQNPAEKPADAPGPSGGTSDKEPDLRKVELQIVEATNELRKQEGRPPLQVNDRLMKAAQEFAVFMARINIMSHSADGKQPWDRTTAQGYQHCLIAENIAYQVNSSGFNTPGLTRGFIDVWTHSPPHLKNMLDGDLDEIGVGVAYNPETQRYFAVQNFGRPKSDAIAFSIRNDSETTVNYAVDGASFPLPPRYTVNQSRCRTPELTFQLTADSTKTETFHPRNGASYVVRRDSDGHDVVTEK